MLRVVRLHISIYFANFRVWSLSSLQVDGRLERVCECGISMEKDQSFPLFEYDKPGADPDEADFEDDNEEF